MGADFMNHSFKIARGLLYISALYVVLVTKSTLFPFIVGKYAWFRGTVDLALLAFAFGLLFAEDGSETWERLKRTFQKPLAVAVSVFTAIFTLAGFFGVDPAMSFWSNFERGEGVLQMLHLFLFFVLLVALFTDKAHWQRFFGWVLAGGAFSFVYGFLAASGVSGFIGAKFSEVGFRFQASIGNPAYVAAFAIFMAFFAGYLLYARYRGRFLSAGAWALYAFLGLAAAVFLLAATRGAFVGLVIGAIVGVGYFVFTHRAWRRWFMIAAAALLLVVGSLVVLKDTLFVKAIPGSRIFDITLTAKTFEDRAIMWGIAVGGWKERPLLGWGPENYLQVFDRKLDPAYFKPAEGFGAWFDRAHSIYFDYLVETGALGFASFFGIFVLLIWMVFRRKPESPKSDESVVPRALMIGAIIAYLVQGIVLFDVLPIYYNLFALFAFGAFTLMPGTDVQKDSSSPWASSLAAATLAVFGVGSLVFGVYAPVAKARAYIGALQTVAEVNTVQGFEEHFRPALDHWSPIGQEEVVKYLASDIADLVAQGNQPEAGARALVEYIEPYLFQNNVRHLLMGGHFYYALWENYGQKPEDYARAKNYYERALLIGPELPPVLYALFDLTLHAGDNGRAREVGNEILRLWPDAENVRQALPGA